MTVQVNSGYNCIALRRACRLTNSWFNTTILVAVTKEHSGVEAECFLE